MKKLIALSLAIVLMLTAVACGGGSSSGSGDNSGNGEQTYVIKLGHDLLETTPQHLGAMRFKELVEEKTGGRVEVQVFPAGQLGTDIETAEMLQTNTVQAALIPTAKLSGFHPPLQVMDLPFIFTDREVMYAVFDDPEFKELVFGPMTDIGLKGISVWESGFKQVTGNKELLAPEDFKGLKFRVMESPLLIAQYEALGASPVPVDFAETYNALQQHVVDGQENPLVSIVSMRFYEVQTNMTLSNHGYLGYAFLFSNAFWETLPADLQATIQECADEAAAYERQVTIDNETGYIETIEQSGTKVSTLTDEQVAAFVEVMHPVHEQFRDVITSEVLDGTYALIEKHAAALAGTSAEGPESEPAA